MTEVVHRQKKRDWSEGQEEGQRQEEISYESSVGESSGLFLCAISRIRL